MLVFGWVLGTVWVSNPSLFKPAIGAILGLSRLGTSHSHLWEGGARAAEGRTRLRPIAAPRNSLGVGVEGAAMVTGTLVRAIHSSQSQVFI